MQDINEIINNLQQMHLDTISKLSLELAIEREKNKRLENELQDLKELLKERND